MAKTRTYCCPDCDGQFNYMQHPSDAPAAPRFCPLCGFDTEADDDTFTKAITAPHIGKPIGKAGDRTYRQMEAQAEERITAAVEMTGQDRADFNDMKITNLQDNLREGDVAAMPMPVNDVTRRMDEMRARGIPVGFGADGAGFAEATRTGPSPYAGLAASNMVKQFHQENAASIIASNQKRE